MDNHLVILIIGFSYALLFSVMGIVRGEGFSMQLVLESVALTLAIAAADWLSRSDLNPALFLAFIYLVTMRSRLLVDLATLFSNRGRQRTAISVLQTALRLFPDRPSRLIVLVAMGVVQLRRENPGSAQALLEGVLEESQKQGGLSLRHAAAVQYNLGIALRHQGKEAQAMRHFREAAQAFPGSPYARAAERAEKEGRQRGTKPAEQADPKDKE